jgi:hypothetical protein
MSTWKQTACSNQSFGAPVSHCRYTCWYPSWPPPALWHDLERRNIEVIFALTEQASNCCYLGILYKNLRLCQIPNLRPTETGCNRNRNKKYLDIRSRYKYIWINCYKQLLAAGRETGFTLYRTDGLIAISRQVDTVLNAWHAYNRMGNCSSAGMFATSQPVSGFVSSWGQHRSVKNRELLHVQAPPSDINSISWPHTGPLFPVPLRWSHT